MNKLNLLGLLAVSCCFFYQTALASVPSGVFQGNLPRTELFDPSGLLQDFDADKSVLNLEVRFNSKFKGEEFYFFETLTRAP